MVVLMRPMYGAIWWSVQSVAVVQASDHGARSTGVEAAGTRPGVSGAEPSALWERFSLHYS